MLVSFARLAARKNARMTVAVFGRARMVPVNGRGLSTLSPKEEQVEKVEETNAEQQQQEDGELISRTIQTNLGPRKVRTFKGLTMSETEYWKEVEREVEKMPKPIDSSPRFKEVLAEDPKFHALKWFHFYRFAIKQFFYEHKVLRKLRVISIVYKMKNNLEHKLATTRHRIDMALMVPYFALFMLPLSYLYLPIFGYLTPSIIPYPFLHPAQLKKHLLNKSIVVPNPTSGDLLKLFGSLSYNPKWSTIVDLANQDKFIDPFTALAFFNEAPIKSFHEIPSHTLTALSKYFGILTFYTTHGKMIENLFQFITDRIPIDRTILEDKNELSELSIDNLLIERRLLWKTDKNEFALTFDQKKTLLYAWCIMGAIGNPFQLLAYSILLASFPQGVPSSYVPLKRQFEREVVLSPEAQQIRDMFDFLESTDEKK